MGACARCLLGGGRAISRALGARRLARGWRAVGGGAARGCLVPLAGERRARRGAVRLALEHVLHRTGHTRAALGLTLALTDRVGILRALAGARARASLLGRRQVDAGTA